MSTENNDMDKKMREVMSYIGSITSEKKKKAYQRGMANQEDGQKSRSTKLIAPAGAAVARSSDPGALVAPWSFATDRKGYRWNKTFDKQLSATYSTYDRDQQK